ncbi:MAG: CPBP family intramembrane metalloprotease [Opitutales bacterium]|nr:CPBP family intramembrane metalloprotease [Opitutales bacterium]
MLELSPDWASPGYIASAWHVLLLVAGGISLFCVLAHHQRWRGLPAPGVREWRVGWIDIGILFCMLFMWALVAGSITARLLPLGEDPTPALRAWRSAIDGTTLQLGMALIFLILWLAQPFERRLSFNSEPMHTGAAFRKALLYILALMPLRYLLEMLWGSTLKLLEGMGLPLPMNAQDVVTDLSVTEPLGAFILLVIMAGLLAPVVEEMVFRAGLYRFLKGRVGKEAAIFSTAALFAMLHYNLLAFPTLMLLGVALCLAYEATGNIKVPMFMHALFNLNSVFLIVLQA